MRAIVVVLVVAAGGCAGQVDYAKSEDPFKTLATATQKGSRASYTACVLPTENSRKAMVNVAEWRAAIARRVMPSQYYDPVRLMSGLKQQLDLRFGDAKLLDGPTIPPRLTCDFAIALDMRIEVGAQAASTNEVYIDMAIADSTGAAIDRVSGSGKTTIPFFPGDAFQEHFLQAWEQAVAGVASNLDRSEPLSRALARAPAGTDAATTELAFWESVKSSTNPADFQAYLQKYPKGTFAGLARARLVALGEPMPARPTPLAAGEAGRLRLGGYHAIVIGINDYRAVPRLATAVDDAVAISAILERDYGFRVTTLLNATRSQMLDAFDDVRRSLKETDNLLIYYAGHGYLDTDSDRGYWLPVDADANRRANWLSNSDLADAVRATRAKHVLVVADSCYSGTLTRAAGSTSSLTDIARLAEKRARTALTSGGLEPVQDSGGGRHSVFAKAFMDALAANAGVVDMSQIFSAMRRQVILGAQQTPQYGDIRQTGHEGGDFIFARKGTTR